MKLILVITSLVAVITAQHSQSSFGRRFFGRNDSPEDRFDDSKETFFRSGNRLRDSRDDSHESSFRLNSGFLNNNNNLDDSREHFGIGRFRSNSGRRQHSRDDSFELRNINTFRSSFGRRHDSPEDSFEFRNRNKNTFGPNFRRLQDSPEDSFEIRNRNTFGSNFRTRQDSPEDSFEVRNRNRFGSNFRRRQDSPEDSFEIRNINRNTFRSSFGRRQDSPEDSFEVRNKNSFISNFGRKPNSPEVTFATRNGTPFKSKFGSNFLRRFDDSDEIIGRRQQSFQKKDNSRITQSIFGSGRTSFNIFDDSPETFDASHEIFDDSNDDIFRSRHPVKTASRKPTISFGIGRNDVKQKVSQPKKPFNFNRNIIRFDESDESDEFRRRPFTGRTNIQRIKPSLNRFDDSPEDHFGRNVNTFHSGVSNNFLDSRSDEDSFNSIFGRTNVSPQHHSTTGQDHFSNRDVFSRRTFGQFLPRTNFGVNRFSGISTPGSSHFSKPVDQRRTTFQTKKKPQVPKKPITPFKFRSQPQKKTPGSFNFNTQFGKPLKITKPISLPKKGRTSFNEIKSNPFSSVKKAGITGFKWPGENISGYYVSMSHNNQPATSYFVKIDD